MVKGPGVGEADLAAAAERWQQDQGGGAEASVVYLSPRGRLLTQDLARELAAGPGVTLLCGRSEGVDPRVLETRQVFQVSVGDYVLSGGEPAAQVLMAAVATLLPRVLANRASPRGAAIGPEGSEGSL